MKPRDGGEKMYPIIDCHCHIYPDKIAVKASHSTGTFYDMEMNYDGKLSTLEEIGKSAHISHSVVFSVATTPKQVKSINEYIASVVAASHGKMTGLGTLHPDSDDMEEDIRHLRELGLRGVKLHPDIQRFKLDDYRCLKIYELCEGNLPVLIHAGDKRYDYSNPNRLKPILETFTGLQVIAAHFGGWSIWEEASRELCGYENLMVDCSSSFPWLDRETSKSIIRRYSADKVLFGADYPMWNPAEQAEYLLSLGLSDEENRKIFYQNAQKLFGIKL